MTEFRDYKRYVADPDWARTYSDYQKQYVINPRESDKKLIRLVVDSMEEMTELQRPPRILDIGCSTGNFLRHLRQALPDARYVGGDLMVPAIEQCRNDTSLAGIEFEVMDVFKIPPNPPFDVVIANAINMYFEPEEYRQVMASIAGALRPEGFFLAYEWVYEDQRERRIVERSDSHPEGLKFWFRAKDFVRAALTEAGFERIDIQPFEIPIDLPRSAPTGTDADLITYTVRNRETGKREMYRGDLLQPWAHILARKAKA